MATMSDEARNARNAYLREWRKKNAERVAETTARYWERKAQEAKKNNGGTGDDQPDGSKGTV